MDVVLFVCVCVTMAMPKKAVNGNLSLVSLVSKSTGGTIPIPKRKKRSISLQLGPKIPLIDGLEPSFTKKGINNATLSMGDVDPNLQPELMIHRNQNYDVNSRLFASAKQRKWDEVIKIIESNGADLEADWEDPNFFSKQSALHFAATHNQATVCEMLVTKCFFNPLKPDRFGRSAWSVSSERAGFWGRHANENHGSLIVAAGFSRGESLSPFPPSSGLENTACLYLLMLAIASILPTPFAFCQSWGLQ